MYKNERIELHTWDEVYNFIKEDFALRNRTLSEDRLKEITDQWFNLPDGSEIYFPEFYFDDNHVLIEVPLLAEFVVIRHNFHNE